MNDNTESKAVLYKKKYPKSYRKYINMLLMAAFYGLSVDKREMLFAILDEPPLRDWEWERIADQDRRLKSLFNTLVGGDTQDIFNDAYRDAMKLANEKIVLMSN